MDFLQLKKNCKKDKTGLPIYKLAIMGDCATQHLATAMEGYGFEKGLYIQVLDTDYNQILAQTFDPSSEIYSFSPDAVMIVNCVEMLYGKFTETVLAERTSFAENILESMTAIWETLQQNGIKKILQFNYPEYDDKVFGSYGNKVEASFLFQLRKLNFLLMEQAAHRGNVHIVDVASLQNTTGRNGFHDAKLYYIAKMPFSMDSLPLVAKEAYGIIAAIRGQIKKCVVLDLDNTLWGGVIGDDGLENIQIGELGLGHAFYEFQKWLKELTKRGILLAVCSKNDEDKAKEPFLKHPEMVLRLEDIAMFVANWEDKASNIKTIQETLNLGMDSFVFIDDNPFERGVVRGLIPEITVPEMPEDPALYVCYLQSLNLFETVSYSSEDADRTKKYQEEAGRVTLKKQFADYDTYLKELEMVAECKAFDSFQAPRIAQLTQRSNQFNLRTIRYSEEDILRIASDDRYITRYFTLKDRFGDHGLISVLIMEKQGDALFVNTWLMSCRVLKRGMEEFIINSLMEVAMEAGAKTVIGEYIKTPKNAMVEDIYGKMGFTADGEGRFLCAVENYQKQKSYIQKAE